MVRSRSLASAAAGPAAPQQVILQAAPAAPVPAPKASRHATGGQKCWLFTLHLVNNDRNQSTMPFLAPDKSDLIDYVCYQEEICPQTGRHHLQGYIEFSQRVQLSHCKSLWSVSGNNAHWEARRGTQAQAITY